MIPGDGRWRENGTCHRDPGGNGSLNGGMHKRLQQTSGTHARSYHKPNLKGCLNSEWKMGAIEYWWRDHGKNLQPIDFQWKRHIEITTCIITIKYLYLLHVNLYSRCGTFTICTWHKHTCMPLPKKGYSFPTMRIYVITGTQDWYITFLFWKPKWISKDLLPLCMPFH